MILTEFCENSKVISCDFSIMKNTVASYSSSLPIKLICCFKSRFSNSICLLKSMQLVYKASKSIYNLINYQMCNLCFYSFQYFFRMFLLCFLLAYQNNFFNQLIPSHLLFQFFVYNTSKNKNLPSSFSNDETNNLLNLLYISFSLFIHFSSVFILFISSFESSF